MNKIFARSFFAAFVGGLINLAFFICVISLGRLYNWLTNQANLYSWLDSLEFVGRLGIALFLYKFFKFQRYYQEHHLPHPSVIKTGWEAIKDWF